MAAFSNRFEGGKGDDQIIASTGSDTFVFNLGDGSDLIVDSGGSDKLLFGAGITQNNIKVTRSAEHIVITVLDAQGNETQDSIKIAKALIGVNYQIEEVEFGDGSRLSANELEILALTQNGTEQADTLTGTMFNEQLFGQDGDDVLKGINGNDLLDGGAGNDQLDAFARSNNILKGVVGDDVLRLVNDDNKASAGFSNRFEGGQGNDTITSYHGADTFVFNRGDGQDTITDFGGNDNLEFGAGITREQITIQQFENRDIIVTVLDGEGHPTGDQLTLVQAFNNDNRRMEQIVFADGTRIEEADILAEAAKESGDGIPSEATDIQRTDSVVQAVSEKNRRGSVSHVVNSNQLKHNL